jgi:hypothetical protein
MAYKDKRDQAAAARRHYLSNKVAMKQRAAKHSARARREIRAWIAEYLSAHPCVDCGETDIVVLEFDHVRGIKVDDVSTLVTRTGLTTVRAEIAKCEVRCANCHRRITYRRRLEAEAGKDKSTSSLPLFD